MSDAGRVKDALARLTSEWYDSAAPHNVRSFTDWFADRKIADDDAELLLLVLESLGDEDARVRLDLMFGHMDDEDVGDDEEA